MACPLAGRRGSWDGRRWSGYFSTRSNGRGCEEHLAAVRMVRHCHLVGADLERCKPRFRLEAVGHALVRTSVMTGHPKLDRIFGNMIFVGVSVAAFLSGTSDHVLHASTFVDVALAMIVTGHIMSTVLLQLWLQAGDKLICWTVSTRRIHGIVSPYPNIIGSGCSKGFGDPIPLRLCCRNMRRTRWLKEPALIMISITHANDCIN